MKKILMTVVVAGGMAASSAFAIPDSGTVMVGRTAGTYTGSGGEFTITAVSPTVFATFQSFCLEENEGIQGNPQTYRLNTGAIAGGVNVGPDGSPGFDPISHGTAWLFNQFTAGTLGGYDFTIGFGRESSAFALQQTIWYLENEITSLPAGLSTTFYNEAVTASDAMFGAGKVNLADNGVQGVFAMNLTVNGINSQDMLAQGGPVLPDGGATLLLLGIGLSGVGMVSRRFRRA